MKRYISLPVAAAIVYRAFLNADDERPKTELALEKHLDEAAHAVSLVVRIYRLDLPDPVEIGRTALGEGVFRDGGRTLLFSDGRPPLDSLGVNKVELDRALSKRAHIVPENRPETIIPSRFVRPKLAP